MMVTLNALREMRQIAFCTTEKAYKDAIYATRNPNIYDLVYVWDKMTLEHTSGGPTKSLARIMHLEEGWNDEALIEVINISVLESARLITF